MKADETQGVAYAAKPDQCWVHTGVLTPGPGHRHQLPKDSPTGLPKSPGWIRAFGRVPYRSSGKTFEGTVP